MTNENEKRIIGTVILIKEILQELTEKVYPEKELERGSICPICDKFDGYHQTWCIYSKLKYIQKAIDNITEEDKML